MIYTDCILSRKNTKEEPHVNPPEHTPEPKPVEPEVPRPDKKEIDRPFEDPVPAKEPHKTE